MASIEDVKRLVEQVTELQKHRTNTDLELQRIVSIEQKLLTEKAKLDSKVQTLDEQFKNATKDLHSVQEANMKYEKEVSIQQEVTMRIGNAFESLQYDLEQLKERVQLQKQNHDTNFESWRRTLEKIQQT